MIFLKSNKHIKEKNGRLSEIPRGVAMSLGIKLVWGGNQPRWNHVECECIRETCIHYFNMHTLILCAHCFPHYRFNDFQTRNPCMFL